MAVSGKPQQRDSSKSLDILIDKAERLYRQDDFAASLQSSHKALRQARTARDYAREVECLILQMKAHMSSGEAAKAKQLSARVITLARGKCPRRVYADALIESGYLHQQYLEYAKAEEYTTEALIIARDETLPELEADALAQLAALDSLRSNHTEALVFLREALRISASLRNIRARLEILLQQGQAYGAMGDYQRAIESFEQVQASSAGHREVLVESLLCQGDVFRSVGDFDKAERLYNAALDESDKHDVPTKTADVLKRVGNLLLHRRDFERALAWFRFAEEQARKFKSESFFPFVALGYGAAYIGLGDYKRAVEYFRRVLDMIAPGYVLHSAILGQTLEQLSLSLAQLNKTGRSSQAAELARRTRELSNTGIDDSPKTAPQLKLLERELSDFITSLRKDSIAVFSRDGVCVDLTTGDVYGEGTLPVAQLSGLQLSIFRLLVEREGTCVSNRAIIGLYERFADSFEGVPRRAHYFVSAIRRKLPVPNVIATVRGSGYKIPHH